MKKISTILALLFLGGFFALQAQVNVTFQVDMSLHKSHNLFNPEEDEVQMRGSFDGWGAGLQMLDGNSDLIYDGTALALTAGDTVYYKFVFVNQQGEITWEGDPNRMYEVPGSDETVDPVYFDKKTTDGNPATVTFSVDMQLPAASDFVPGTDRVFVAGSFTDWGTSPVELLDGDGDLVYSADFDETAGLLGGNQLFFKYIYGDTATGNITWENDPNRELILWDGGNSYFDYWDRVSPNQTFADGNIQFTVDMSVMEGAGIFDQNADSLRLYGSFNGWGPNDPAFAMNQDFLNLSEWFINFPFTNQVVGSENFYKFFVDLNDTATIWVDGWERPINTGGGNRVVEFEGIDNQVVEKVYYDDILPEYSFGAGETLSITFRVDMTPAQTDLTFDPATDEVWWIAEQPSLVFSQGWEDSDTIRVLQLTDDNSDMVYEGTLTINGPAWNTFVYRYAYIHDGSWQQETAGFGDFAYRVRFVAQTAPNTFVQPYTAPVDTWTDQENKQDQSEVTPYGTSVKETGLVADKYELSQNYPNPFNPSTIISFSLPETQNVTLRVHNILGEEVATLFNGELKNGSYEFEFNGRNISSGIYFYTIQAGDFVQTRKMMMIK